MRYYPVFLDIVGKPVVVIGGGNIAHVKVVGLLKAGAEVTVVSPELNAEMAALSAQRRFRHFERDYEPGDLEGYTLAFVATDDRSVNSTVADEGKARKVWVNAVDDPPYCDFIMPGMNGRELAARLRAWQPAMKVLYVSAYSDEEIAALGVQETAVPILRKPFTAETLARTVRELLD